MVEVKPDSAFLDEVANFMDLADSSNYDSLCRLDDQGVNARSAAEQEQICKMIQCVAAQRNQ